MLKQDCIFLVFKGYDMTHSAVLHGAQRSVWKHMMHLWGLELITSRNLEWDINKYAQIPNKPKRGTGNSNPRFHPAS